MKIPKRKLFPFSISYEKKEISNHLDSFLFGAYIIFLVSVVFSFRAVSSISIAFILLAAIARGVGSFNDSLHNKNDVLLLAGCCLLFLIQCISLFYTDNVTEGFKLLQRRTALIVIPFAVFCSGNFFTAEKFSKLASYFSAMVGLASLYCLLITAFNYFSGAPVSSFFYHDLVKPLSQHAIQFSILVFIALLFVIENSGETKRHFTSAFNPIMITFLTLFLLLLSSKLIISCYIFYLTSYILRSYKNRVKNFAFYLVFIVVVLFSAITPNPISNRFRSIITGNSLLFEQSKFNPGVNFNGVQFRLLEWRFSFEILNEKKAWIKGVTPGDAQQFLDRKYKETNMYTGIPGTERHGFLGYHTHNQFLQSLLENGLPGLAIFFLICFSLLNMATVTNKRELKWLVALLVVYCFTDAPFETQYGMVIFLFFPALYYLGSQNQLKAVDAVNLIGSHISKPLSVKQPN